MKTQGNATLLVTPRVLLFLQRGGKWLFIQGAAHKWWSGKFNGIGGSVEPGEDVLTAARRETVEETGLPPTTLDLAAVVSVVSDPQVILFVFVGELAEGDLQASPEGELHWLTPEQLDTPTTPTFEDFPFLWARLKKRQPQSPPLYMVFDYSNGFLGREM